MSTPDAGEAPPPPGTLRGSVFRGSAWQIAGRVIPQTYAIVTSIVAARALGAGGLGRLTFIVFVEASLVIVFTAGLPYALSRFVAEAVGAGRVGAVRALAAWVRRVELVGAAGGAALLVAIALLGADPRSAWLLAAVACASSVLQTVPSSTLIGLQRWRDATIVGLSTGSAAMAAKVALLAAGYGIPALLAVDAVVTTTNLAVSTLLARRALEHVAPRPASTGDLVRRTRRYALVASVGVLLTYVVLGRSEVFFLERFSSDVQIAFYSLSFSAVYALTFVPMSIAAAAGQAFALFFGAGATERIRAGYGRAVRLTLLVALPLTAIAASLGPAAFRAVYGPDFSATRPVLLVMVFGFPVVATMFVANALLAGLGRQRVQVIAAGVAAAVDVALALALVPPFDAVGAAVANVVSQTLSSVLIVVAAGRAVGRVEWELGALARVALASALAGLAALAMSLVLPDGPAVVAGLVVFAAAFAALALALPVLAEQDARWLVAAVGGRLRGVPASLVRRWAPTG